jgi:hypothetical protein
MIHTIWMIWILQAPNSNLYVQNSIYLDLLLQIYLEIKSVPMARLKQLVELVCCSDISVMDGIPLKYLSKLLVKVFYATKTH